MILFPAVMASELQHSPPPPLSHRAPFLLFHLLVSNPSKLPLKTSQICCPRVFLSISPNPAPKLRIFLQSYFFPSLHIANSSYFLPASSHTHWPHHNLNYPTPICFAVNILSDRFYGQHSFRRLLRIRRLESGIRCRLSQPRLADHSTPSTQNPFWVQGGALPSVPAALSGRQA